MIAPMPSPTDARFVFAICQAGAEAALKNEVARRHPPLKFAFSRPGFVTFRLPGGLPPDFALDCAFARTWGWSLGKAQGAAEDLPRAFLSLAAEHFSPHELAQFSHLHVWPRERVLPGDPEPDAGAPQPPTAGPLLLEQAAERNAPWRPALNAHAKRGERVLDGIVVEPNEWWLGWHRTNSPETCWPGGAPNLPLPSPMVSRAYLKLAEALLWSGLPVGEGDRCVEIGSAPGGSCLALLERGCIVAGIDPAAMDARVLLNPRFTHYRARAKEVPRHVYADCRWLTVDVNAAPKYTLDTVDAIVALPGVEIDGLVLTLKLTHPALAAQLPAFTGRIASWGYSPVRVRQLAYNRQEVCVVALRQPKDQRSPHARKGVSSEP